MYVYTYTCICMLSIHGCKDIVYHDDPGIPQLKMTKLNMMSMSITVEDRKEVYLVGIIDHSIKYGIKKQAGRVEVAMTGLKPPSLRTFP